MAITGKIPDTKEEITALKTFTVKRTVDSDGTIHNKLEVDATLELNNVTLNIDETLLAKDLTLQQIETALGTNLKTQEQNPITGFALDNTLTNGNQKTQITSPTSIVSGNKVVSAINTPVQLLTASTSCQIVVITALLANTGLISVGDSATSASGTVKGDVLAAGDSTSVSIDNVNKVYISGTVISEGVSFRYQS